MCIDEVSVPVKHIDSELARHSFCRVVFGDLGSELSEVLHYCWKIDLEIFDFNSEFA